MRLDDPVCPVCDQPVSSGPWLLLNRYAIGSGRHRVMSEGLDEDGEYAWEQHPDGAAEDEQATGNVFHWPVCAGHWIEGKMLAVDAHFRNHPPPPTDP